MNDERPIEKLLRRAAKKRSDEAGLPPALHSANRRLLQAEVARVYPKPDPSQRSSWAGLWAMLTQRWIYAIGVVVVLAVATIAILPGLLESKSDLQLAQSTPSPAGRELDLAESVVMEPASPVATLTMMDEDAARIPGPSGGGNFKPRTIAPNNEPASAPADHFERENSDRRIAGTDEFARFADTTTASGTLQPAPAQTGRDARRLATGAPGAPVTRSAPASVTLRAQPTRDLGLSDTGGAGGSAAPRIAAESGLKAESSQLAADSGARQKEFDSLETVTVKQAAAAPVASTLGALEDKSWIPRGGGAESERGIRNSQSFSNLSVDQLQPARAKAAPARKDLVPVLVNFKIEQQGRQMQVIDGDGSVYQGVVDEPNTLYKQVVTRQEQRLSTAYENNLRFQSPKAGGSVAKKVEPANFYFYRVEGTNRSLNQNVVFTWNFVPTNEAIAAAQLNYEEVLKKADATKLPSQFPALLQNSLINGRAQFGEGREIEVNAVPVKP
jgi:hypothetical protein